ncbi:MAG: polyhydroxyalkanoic acid system family protein [Acidobacteriota bacterium]
MRIEVEHHTTREKARQIIEKKMADLERQYGHHADGIERTWTGDLLNFVFKARGMTGKGSLEITDTGVIVDGKLPLLAKPFESRIKSTVEREASEMFQKA